MEVRAGCVVESRRLARESDALHDVEKRRAARAPFGGHLTPRELEIARLLVRKWSNKDIARALAISVRTVDHHAEAVFSKLGINSRWQLNETVLDGVSSR
jgi:DNA-binding NarL/FixJ family response regulator